MSKRNPIATLLRLREIREKQRAGDLAAQQRVEAEALDELAARRKAHEERARPAAQITAAELRVLSLQGIRSLELVAEAAAALEHEHDLTLEARRRWEDANRDLKSVERLDDRRRTEMAIEARRAADRALDELVVTRRRQAEVRP
jgi:flagellar export protein FliJ